MDRNEKIKFLITNIKGVGPAKANKIADAFPNDNLLTEIIWSKENAEKLKAIVGLQLTESIIAQLAEIKKQDMEVQKMVKYGIPYFAAMSIVKNPQRHSAFLKNPYVIGKQENIPFTLCDRMAHVLFCKSAAPDMSKSRMEMLIEAMLIELENSGHTFAYLSQLTKKINKYQKTNIYLPDNYECSTLLPYLLNNEMIEIEKAKNINRWKIYRKETFDLEAEIAFHIKRLSANKKIAEVCSFSSDKLQYDDIQLAAIQSASTSGLKVITGPPGSGKTAVINGIITFLLSLNKSVKIALCAPTGRAAKHMEEITGKQAFTLHKLLGIGTEGKFSKKKKLDCNVVICDEASMLNLTLTFELLSRIKTGTIVYFVGDKDQLPAVGPGNVLHDIINSGIVPVYHLNKVYRQDGIILENANLINSGVVPQTVSSKYQVSSFNDPKILKDKAVDCFKKLYDPAMPFETQILVPSYKTECGITAINTAIQALNPEPYIYIPRTGVGCSYKKYDKILMTRNDKSGLYQNGSVGIFISNGFDELTVEFDGEQVTLPQKAIDDMTLGYAISVHKAQGSEYQHVILCLPNKPLNMLKRNILYTGVTRAKDDLYILEMEGAIQQAIETNAEPFMQTGLKEKIIKIMQK